MSFRTQVRNLSTRCANRYHPSTTVKNVGTGQCNETAGSNITFKQKRCPAPGTIPLVQGSCYMPGRTYRRGQEQTPPFLLRGPQPGSHSRPALLAGTQPHTARETWTPPHETRCSSSCCRSSSCYGPQHGIRACPHNVTSLNGQIVVGAIQPIAYIAADCLSTTMLCFGKPTAIRARAIARGSE